MFIVKAVYGRPLTQGPIETIDADLYSLSALFDQFTHLYVHYTLDELGPEIVYGYDLDSQRFTLQNSPLSVQDWFTQLGNTTPVPAPDLPAKRMHSEKARYCDVSQTAYTLKRVYGQAHLDHPYPESDKQDLALIYDEEKAQHARHPHIHPSLVSLNGYLHWTHSHLVGNDCWIQDAFKHLQVSGKDTVGVIDLSALGPYEMHRINQGTVTLTHDSNGNPFRYRVALVTEMPVDRYVPVLVLMGKLYYGRYITVFNETTLLFDIEGANLALLHQQWVKDLDLTAFQIPTGMTPDVVRQEDLLSDAVITRLFESALSFLILFHDPQVTLFRESLAYRVTDYPNRYLLPRQVTSPLTGAYGKLINYLCFQDWGQWVIATDDNTMKDYLFNSVGRSEALASMQQLMTQYPYRKAPVYGLNIERHYYA